MTIVEDRSCGCDPLPHPPKPDIPAGLATLAARQLSGFPEYRAAMLTAIPAYQALADWRARSEGDLGVMLLEAWAVVLDTTGFYDARIAERSYLSTAPDAATARNLTALIGHKPRPATAAKVKLAVEAEGADPVTLPKGTGFRSGAFEGNPPQVFELTSAQEIWPQRNRWQLAPHREPGFDGTLRFLPRAAPSASAVLALWTASKSAAVRIASVDPDPAPDGVNYQKATLEAESTPGLAGLIGENRADIYVAILRIPAPEFRSVTTEATFTKDLVMQEQANTGGGTIKMAEVEFAGQQPAAQGQMMAEEAISTYKTRVSLDSLYPQIRNGQRAVAEIGGSLHPVKITGVRRVFQTVDASTDPETKQPVTQVDFTPGKSWTASDDFVLHVYPFTLGPPSRIAKTQIALDDIEQDGALVPPVDLADAPGGGTVIARGQRAEGAELDGTVIEDGDGQANFAPNSGVKDFGTLQAPVSLYGNVVEAVRGETVGDEELGSGNAGAAHQSFTLKKAPLAWVADATLAEGRRPELTVRVNGVEWSRVDTFFGKGRDEQIYTVTLEADGKSTVNFGDGKRGARLPTGVGNVRAGYRFGAGSAKPPAGSIAQIARSVKGLLSVRGPLPATGGGDAETPDELRIAAPASALTLGRAVSLDDFEAMARGYDGILNAASAWAWDVRRQRASAKIWIIADSGDPSEDLADYLSARAAPDLIVAVELAGAADIQTLSITLGYADAHDPALVRDAVDDALFDDKTGFLAPRNQTIGAALFRSALTHRIHEVPGVASVRSILVDGAPMERGLAPGQGNWFDIQSGTTVS